MNDSERQGLHGELADTFGIDDKECTVEWFRKEFTTYPRIGYTNLLIGFLGVWKVPGSLELDYHKGWTDDLARVIGYVTGEEAIPGETESSHVASEVAWTEPQ